jgi:uncharacterized protein
MREITSKITLREAAQRFLMFPLTRILVGVILISIIVGFSQTGMRSLLDHTEISPRIKTLLTGIMTGALSLLIYYFLFKFYEKRRITELSGRGLVKQLFTGACLGAFLHCLTILVIWLRGGFTIVSVNPLWYIISPLTMSFTSAIFEEVLVRGVIFRIMEEKLGTYISLVISAIIFGALHLGNPNSSPTAALGLALQAGVFLAAAYVFTRSLWFPIAIHFAWNFTQGGIFGASVSGNPMARSLFSSRIEGAGWYTGGSFGPEGSVQATLFCFVAGLVLLYYARKRGLIIRPWWQQGRGVEFVNTAP